MQQMKSVGTHRATKRTPTGSLRNRFTGKRRKWIHGAGLNGINDMLQLAEAHNTRYGDGGWQSFPEPILEAMIEQHEAYAKFMRDALIQKYESVIAADAARLEELGNFDMRNQKRALNYFRRTHWGSKAKDACDFHISEYVLKCALAHPETVSQWISQVTNYCRDEGLDQFKYMSSRIAGRPEYARA
jgi:hypothetical protein